MSPNSSAAVSIASSGSKTEQAPLPPPKNDPIPKDELKNYDGSDKSKPVYVAIKGIVFDVTSNREAYCKPPPTLLKITSYDVFLHQAPGQGYNIFAGKDGSKALGKSSLKVEDAVSDISELNESEMKVLDDWVTFFQKRYPIVGKVVE